MNAINLTKVALRYRALFLDVDRKTIEMSAPVPAYVLAFARRMQENGFGLEEELLHALCKLSVQQLNQISDCIDEVMGINLNWAPLVKGWDVPTGETVSDHLITAIVNIFGHHSSMSGTTLPCGHFIPEGTFPIERYNGCPFCGTPFHTAREVFKGQGSRLKILRLYTTADMLRLMRTLLESPVPLDATQKASLLLLLGEFSLPDNLNIPMKETAMTVVSTLCDNGRHGEATKLLKTPTDILRYLWYEKTGQLQIIEPHTLIRRAGRNNYHMCAPLNKANSGAEKMTEKLRLKYDRRQCRMVAEWMEALPMTAAQAVENMNPKREMWVRFIHALRLGDYSRRKGFGHLAEILDLFYRQDYATWQGKVDKSRAEGDMKRMLNLLKQRPGMFARCLFATMLRFGSVPVLDAFVEIAGQIPPRLLLSLMNSAELYFDPRHTRIASPITGGKKVIPHNPLLNLYSEEELASMVEDVKEMYLAAMGVRFASHCTDADTVYIDPILFNVPVAISDRSSTIQDISGALQGMRFPIEGDSVRLFLQWGKGLKAQHLDMDLSCRITLPEGKVAECAYYSLTCPGAKHSGDIRSIPDLVGTAEYIELSLPELEAAGARHVIFTCNAYSCGALSPGLTVGWMDSAYPMKVSETDGVSYDPSCVNHMVRVDETNLSKGLVFGVLDVALREIIWLEMPFTSQTIKGANAEAIEALLKRLASKVSIGQLLRLRADTLGQQIVDSIAEAQEQFTSEWALDPANVASLLCD